MVAVLDGAARTRSARRRGLARWLRNLALVCLALAVAGAAIDYFGPASPRPRGWFTGADLSPNLSEQIGGAALVLVMVTMVLALAVYAIRFYDFFVREGEARRR